MTAAEVPLNAEARVPRWFIWLGLIGLAAYAGLLAVNMTAVAGGSDSSGYLNSAKLFAEGKVRTPLRVPPEFATRAVDPIHFMPGGFKTFPVHRDLAPSYPAGFPLHLALGGRLLGWRAGPFCVQMMAAVGAVWLCYLAARALGLHFALAAAGAVMLAASPVFLYTAVQTLSDTLATTWSLAALLCALRGRASPRWAAAAGVALALAVLVRPTNLLIAPGLVILLAFDARRIGWFVLGGVPGAIWLLLYHHFLYGGALRSGYGDIFAAFAWENLAPTAAHYGKWLPLFLPAVVLVLPFAALARHDPHRRESIAFLLIFAAVTGLYLFCAFSHEAWTCLRYLLPVVPALILAALLGLEALARGPAARWPRVFRPAAALVLALWAAGGSWHLSRQLGVFWIPVYERAYEEAARYVREHVPANGLVACGLLGGAVYYYTEHPTLLADSIEPEQFLRYVRVARQAGRPIFAAVFVTEEPDTIRRHCPGRWTRIAGAGNIGIWRLDAERAEDVKRDAPR